MSYENHYGIQLLDDIHNYFPAILYEHDRFQSVPQLLQYIRSQVRERFDLFSNADAAHARMRRPQQAHSMMTRTSIRPRAEDHTTAAATVILDPQDDIQSLSMQLLRELLMAPRHTSSLVPAVYYGITGATGTTNPSMDPVIVRPTAAQIATATTLETVVGEEEMCAICQDSIVPGTEARSINFCDHTFHTGCIDTWFTTNVRCPVCRHDIREEV